MALPTLDATFASAADLPRRQMLAKWLVEELGETQAPSSVLVSGAGTDVNGLYVYDGTHNGKGKWSLSATKYIQADDNGDGLFWYINNDEIDPFLYVLESDTEYPWQGTYLTNNGAEPTPTVTESPAPSPLSNYYSLPERYLWAKIAVAAGAPRGEADYISLPKNYAWSDIYNAVSGDIANSTVVVSGLTNNDANGRYLPVGQFNGRASYSINESRSIYWGDGVWTIDVNGNQASSTSDVAYPWLADGWVNDGLDPTGLVMIPQTPNHTDWTEKQAIGHIAAAYRGDASNPENLATYIDWPWRYQVASIITSL